MREHKSLRIAKRFASIWGSLLMMALGALLGASVAAALIVSVDAIFDVRPPVWIRFPLGAVAVTIGLVLGYKSRKVLTSDWSGVAAPGKLLLLLMAVAGIVMTVWLLPFFFALWFLLLVGGAEHFTRRLPSGKIDRNVILSPAFIGFIVVISLAIALGSATDTTLTLDRMHYGQKVNGQKVEVAGLISANAEEVVVAVCWKDGKHQLHPRLWRVPRTQIKIVKVGGDPFVLKGRPEASATLADVVFGDFPAKQGAPTSCG
jgi:hypothetical protein